MELFLQEDLCKDLRDIRVVNLIVSMYVRRGPFPYTPPLTVL